MRAVWSSILLASLASDAFGAQRLVLELRPHFGDTLHMGLEQTTEVTGTRRGAMPTTMTTTMRMYSRAIVEQNSLSVTTILAITDSVDLQASDPRAAAMMSQVDKLPGRQMRFRLRPDGTVAVSDASDDVPREVSEMLAVMPASFPRQPVVVGDTWVREMPLPPGSWLDIPIAGVVRARFRLDSASRSGDLAYLSVTGVVETPGMVAAIVGSEALTGNVKGTLVVNRRRGWLSESHFVMNLRSTVPVAGKPAADAVRFRMRVTQHLRVVEKRP